MVLNYLFLLNSTLGWPQGPHTEQCPTPFTEAFAALIFFFFSPERLKIIYKEVTVLLGNICQH